MTYVNAGTSPVAKTYTVGFEAKGKIKRTDFGVKTYAPMIWRRGRPHHQRVVRAPGLIPCGAGRGERYTRVAILLHWLIALGILAMLAMGLRMTHAAISTADKFWLYQLHKSVGLTILALAVLRLLWRLAHRPPALPAAMPRWEKGAAEGTHVVLYAFMIGMPLIGWAMVSMSPFGIPTLWFGKVRVPDLSFLTALGSKAALEPVLKAMHAYGAYVMIAILLLHAGAALRHYLIERDGVLQRMIPGLPPIGTPRHGDVR